MSLPPFSRRLLLAAGLTLALPGASAPRRRPRAAPARQPESAAAPAHGGRPGSYADRADVRAWAQAQTAAGAPLAGWPLQGLIDQLGQGRYQAKVAQLILPPPAGVAKDWGAYRDRFIEPRRLRAGLQFWELHAASLQRAEAQYQVPASLIAGIIGVETFYGQLQGSFRVLDALLTLGFDFPGGRSDRSAFFRDELAAFLLLAQAEGRSALDFRGSFAGAMGMGQFMPSSWRAYAVDFDSDAHIDLAGNAADAIGSVANFLVRHGWQGGQRTHLFVEPPVDAAARARLLAPDIEPRWSLATLQAEGLPLGPAQLELVERHGPWALIALDNGGLAPATHLLGSRNFWVVTRYNRSAYYALAVLELGERLRALREAGS